MRNVYLVKIGPNSVGDAHQDICKDKECKIVFTLPCSMEKTTSLNISQWSTPLEPALFLWDSCGSQQVCLLLVSVLDQTLFCNSKKKKSISNDENQGTTCK